VQRGGNLVARTVQARHHLSAGEAQRSRDVVVGLADDLPHGVLDRKLAPARHGQLLDQEAGLLLDSINLG
jgi:hypothetical protein